MYLKCRAVKAAIFSLLFIPSIVTAQIQVTDNQTALQLAQKLTGHGVTVLNPVLTCPGIANGIFTAVNSNLGIDSGIVLTTGRARTNLGQIGVNGTENNLASTRNNAPGDPELDYLAGQNTFDACKLEFDLIPSGDSIKFDYVFSSEEYINATCGPYNDAFAFFISGPGIAVQQNMALVPGTQIPVTINSINSGIPGPGYNISTCRSMGTGSPFTQYFVNNLGGTTVTHRGFTKVMKAVYPVMPCSTYHLKMVIADAGNYIYDSGVFIKANSLTVPSVFVNTVSNNADTPFVVRGCAPGTFRISVTHTSSAPQIIQYTLGGNALNGIDYAQLSGTAVIPADASSVDVSLQALTAGQGTKNVVLYVYSPYSCQGGNNASDSAMIEIRDAPNVRILTPDTSFCQQKGIRVRVSGPDWLTYSWSPASGLDSPKIKEPFASPQTSTTYNLTASWPNSGCPDITRQISISSNKPPAPYVTSPLYYCTGQAPDTLKAEGTQITWYLQPVGGAGTVIAPVVQTSSRGIFRYYVSQAIPGCESDRSMIEAVVEKCCDEDIFIPTAFTPNNDGRNDVFRITPNHSQLVGYLYIFNRWGQTVFSGTGDQGWDGTQNGMPVETGVYYYVAEIRCRNGVFFQRKGDIMLVR